MPSRCDVQLEYLAKRAFARLRNARRTFRIPRDNRISRER